MSVLIKGMEMPKCCGMCNAFFEKGDGFSCTITDTEVERLWYKRNKDCPLVEIPSKHGDLIDRDELKAKIEKLKMKSENGYINVGLTMALGLLQKSAPTIIEAEG